jgi:hypothetical protein
MVEVEEAASDYPASFEPGLVDLPLFPVRLHPSPVGARLLEYWRNWEVIGAEPWVLSVVRKGYRLEFQEYPPLLSHPPFSRIPTRTEGQSTLDLEVQELVDKRAVEVLKHPVGPGFYSSIFLVPKKEPQKFRLVINLRPLNAYLIVKRFRMETSRTVTAALHQGDWVVSLDLKDAYFHIPIHPRFRRYLRFVHRGRVLEFRALPFGLATAPYVFTRVTACLAQAAHRRLLHLYLYLDDWLLRSTLRTSLEAQIPLLLHLTDYLGFIRNREKSCLVPSQEFVFLGVWYDLIRALARPPEDRWMKIQDWTRALLRRTASPASQWCKVLGLLTSVQDVVPLGRLYVRKLQIHLNRFWCPRHILSVEIPMTEECRQQLHWWLRKENVMPGVSVNPFSPKVQMFTDASNTGWGAHVGDKMFAGDWSTEEARMHINCLELLAVTKTVQEMLAELSNSQILVATDNSTVVSYINKQGGTRSPTLCQLTETLLCTLHTIHSEIRARHIPGKRNVIADQLSRRHQILGGEWSLHPEIVRQLSSMWGVPQVDLFATRHNNKCPLFVSPVPDERAWAVDALSLDWSDLVAYAYPPTALIPLVLQKIIGSTTRILLIAPLWPRRSWFPLLLELLEEPPWQLPLWRKLIQQPHNGLFHQSPEVLNLHAWPLSGVHYNKQVSQRTLLSASLRKTDRPPIACTSPDGGGTSVGVRDGEWIHSRPLFL